MTSAGSFRRLLLTCVAGVALTAPSSAVTRDRIDAVSATRLYTATIHRLGTDPSGFARYALSWRRQETGGDAQISSEIQTISSFEVLDDGRAVLVGKTGVDRVSAFHAISLADASTIVVNECYSPSLSPDGRYIAYVGIHPQRVAAHGKVAISWMSEEYRVADLTIGDVPVPPSYPIDLQKPSDPAHTHVMEEPIVWDGSAHFHFADRFAGRTNRVYIEMDSGKPKVASSVDVNS